MSNNLPDSFQINEKPLQALIDDTDSFPLQQADDETKRAYASTIWAYVANKLSYLPNIVDHTMLSNAGSHTHSQIDKFINDSSTTFATYEQGQKADTALQPNGDGSGLINMTKDQVGLDQADNTSDINKPVSTAAQNALNLKENNLITTTVIYVDGNRSDSYTANGTIARPYKTINSAISSLDNSSCGYTILISPSIHASAEPLVIPNVTVTIDGNGSIIYGSIILSSSACIIKNVNLYGNITVTSSTGSVTLIDSKYDGVIDTHGSVALNNVEIIGGHISGYAGSEIELNNSQSSSYIVSYGDIILRNSNITLVSSSTVPLIESLSGGSLHIYDSSLDNKGTGIGISCDNGCSGSINDRYNIISNTIVSTASSSAISCNSSYTIISDIELIGGSVSGSGIKSYNYDVLGTSLVKLGSDATGDIYYRNSSGNLTRLGIGSSGQMLYANGSTPYWSNPPTDTTGAKYIIQSPNSSIPNAQSLSTLTTGVLKSTTGSGVISIATCDDLADGVNYHLINTSQLSLLNSTSGINTGDQTNIPGNAATATLADAATKLATARKINGIDFDGTSDIIVSPSIDTNVNNIKKDGIASIGASGYFVYSDHAHPTDTTRAALIASPTNGNIVLTDSTGQSIDSGKSIVTTIGSDDSTIPTSKAVASAISGISLNFETSSSNIKINGTASVGSLSTVPRADHVHPTDTTRLSATATTLPTTFVNSSITKLGLTSAGFVKTSAAGALSVDTTTYLSASATTLPSSFTASSLTSVGTLTGLTCSGNITCSTVGNGIYLKDETTSTNWQLHTHGDTLRIYNGSTEYTFLRSIDAAGTANALNTSNNYTVNRLTASYLTLGTTSSTVSGSIWISTS